MASDPIVQELLAVFRRHERFVIVTHVRPDGDALGSQLGLGLFLRKLGKTVHLLSNDPAPRNLGWMVGRQDVLVFNGSLKQREIVAQAEVVIVVDTNSLDRLGQLAGPVSQSGAVKVLIDHHPHPETWFDHVLSRVTASSTGELVYEIVSAENRELIDGRIAVALYTAIMTDTGSFQYNSMTPHVHRVVAELLERGDINPEPIHIAVFHTRSLDSLRLLGMSLATITLFREGRLGHMTVTQEMLRTTGTTAEDTEGFVNYLLAVSTVEAAVLFLELESGVKMSFRSKGEVSINGWARQFGGGGHRNAAGAFVKRPLQPVVAEVLAAAETEVEFGAEPPPEPSDGEAGALPPDDAALLSMFENRRKP